MCVEEIYDGITGLDVSEIVPGSQASSSCLSGCWQGRGGRDDSRPFHQTHFRKSCSCSCTDAFMHATYQSRQVTVEGRLNECKAAGSKTLFIGAGCTALPAPAATG